MDNPQVHDLLEIEPDSLIPSLAVAPLWARETFASCPWVVVRRAHSPAGQIAVGVRGAARYERWGSFCARDGVRSIVPPEKLLDLFRSSTRVLRTPALKAICELSERWSDLVLPWGTAGSVGFELATGRQVTTETSDLDLIIRARKRMSKQTAQFLWERTEGLGVRIDILVETPECGFSLEEYARSISPRILLRRKDGSSLGDDPWSNQADRHNTEAIGS